MAEPWTPTSPLVPPPRVNQPPRPTPPSTLPQGADGYATTDYATRQPEPVAAHPATYATTEAYAASGEPGYAYSDSYAPKASLTLRQRLVRSWPFWSIGALVLVGGIGIASAISLFRIPNLPNCRAIVWVTASATTRIQCAEAYANQGTVEGYLDAISLVEELPDDHPLSHDIAQRVEVWAERILDLAEGTFQAGELQQAIGMARQIPNHTGAAEVVDERVSEWKAIWDNAEAIYAAAQQELQALEFQNAFSQAIQLLEVGNDYWETIKYDELSAAIAAARDDLNELGRAKRLAKQRTLQSMQDALEIVQSIDRESPLYNESQTLVRMFGRDLLAMAEEALDRRDVELAEQMLAAIPLKLQMGEEIADMRVIMEATKLSWQGGLIGLEGGIVRLQSIGSDRPLYPKAQTLMRRWQDQADGLAQLEWAREVALPGTVADLQAAINEADQISPGNPVWDEAQAEIKRWRGQIQTSQDRPFLIQADQLAQVGDLPGAIAAARQVAPGRALYPDAQEKITTWRRQLQRNEDGPILAQAQQLANAGQLQAAIAMASRIQSGRVLYRDAQADIDTWQGQIQGQQNLQRAYQVAQRGRIPDLVEAIEMARSVPSSSPQKAEANQALTRWSWDIFRMAETESQYSLNRAIEMAESVPPQTEAYAQAQLSLREWQSILDQSVEGNFSGEEDFSDEGLSL
jgi:soluble cytochrome b562